MSDQRSGFDRQLHGIANSCPTTHDGVSDGIWYVTVPGHGDFPIILLSMKKISLPTFISGISDISDGRVALTPNAYTGEHLLLRLPA